MSGFLLDLATLRGPHQREEVESPARDVGLPEQEWRAPVRGSFQVEKSGERVAIRGSVRSTATLECVRCLAPFDVEIEAPVVVLAERSGTSPRDEQEELERDDQVLFHDGRRLDLRGFVREALLLEIPITPHCREDCPGLCPKCGADLNLGPCACGRGA